MFHSILFKYSSYTLGILLNNYVDLDNAEPTTMVAPVTVALQYPHSALKINPTCSSHRGAA